MRYKTFIEMQPLRLKQYTDCNITQYLKDIKQNALHYSQSIGKNTDNNTNTITNNLGLI